MLDLQVVYPFTYID